MKRTTMPSTILGVLLLAPCATPADHPFQDPQRPVEERITSILSLMTLDEKIEVLGTDSGVPRLGIPNAGRSEGIHGLVQRSLGGLGRQESVTTTQFAQVVGMGRTWNEDLVRRAGEVQAEEARWIYNNAEYDRQPLIVWGPNADLARDPRWGRIDESYGEDAFFVDTMSVAFVRGMQGDDPRYWRVASLLKHFMANSNERGRYGSNLDFDTRQMREYYSLPFRMAFMEGGARSYMAAYNAWNGIPMTVHPMLGRVLRQEWASTVASPPTPGPSPTWSRSTTTSRARRSPWPPASRSASTSSWTATRRVFARRPAATSR